MAEVANHAAPNAPVLQAQPSVGGGTTVGELQDLRLQQNMIYVLLIALLQLGIICYFGCHGSLRVRQVSIALVGIFWCAAALKVEYTMDELYPHFHYHHPPADMSKYTPFCDFAGWAKCSKVLMSPYGRVMRYSGIAARGSMLDVPNPVLGFLFFSCHLAYPHMRGIPVLGRYVDPLALAACVLVCIFSLWLAHKLFFVLHDFCIVCVSSYVANFLLLHTMVAQARANREAAKEGPFTMVAPSS